MLGLYSIMVSAPDCGSGDLSSILDKDMINFVVFLCASYAKSEIRNTVKTESDQSPVLLGTTILSGFF